MTEVPRMVTIKTAALETGLSYSYIMKLCKQGKIVNVRSGVKYLVNYGNLISYLCTGEGA